MYQTMYQKLFFTVIVIGCLTIIVLVGILSTTTRAMFREFARITNAIQTCEQVNTRHYQITPLANCTRAFPSFVIQPTAYAQTEAKEDR